MACLIGVIDGFCLSGVRVNLEGVRVQGAVRVTECESASETHRQTESETEPRDRLSHWSGTRLGQI